MFFNLVCKILDCLSNTLLIAFHFKLLRSLFRIETMAYTLLMIIFVKILNKTILIITFCNTLTRFYDTTPKFNFIFKKLITLKCIATD